MFVTDFKMSMILYVGESSRGKPMLIYSLLETNFRYARARFDPPEKFISVTPTEWRVGLTKKKGDLENEYVNRFVAWFRVNSISYSIGRERGDKERHLHLNGCVTMHLKNAPGVVTAAKAHLRAWLNPPKGRGYQIFFKPFVYRYGMALESYIGYTVKDMGSTWFAHFHSPDITPERIEHAAFLRRLLDNGRQDQIVVKFETAISQVPACFEIL
jgi:hypothetical protein